MYLQQNVDKWIMVWLLTNDTRVIVLVVAPKQHGAAVGAKMMMR
jgi:hypothetical protein